MGFAPVAFWFAGALLGNFGIIVGGTAAGLFDVVTAQGIVKSLGMGLMMGFGVAVVLKDILPQTAPALKSFMTSPARPHATATMPAIKNSLT